MRDESWGLQRLQPERVPVEDDDPHYADHELLFAFQRSVNLRVAQGDFADNELFGQMSQLPPSRRVELIEVALVRIAYTRARRLDYRIAEDLNAHQGTFPLVALIKNWLEEPMALTPEDMERLMDLALQKSNNDIYSSPLTMARLVPQLEKFTDNVALLRQWRPRFLQMRQALSPNFASHVGSENLPYTGNAAMRFFRIGAMAGQMVIFAITGKTMRGANWAKAPKRAPMF